MQTQSAPITVTIAVRVTTGRARLSKGEITDPGGED
jgi:hypothetical protein